MLKDHFNVFFRTIMMGDLEESSESLEEKQSRRKSLDAKLKKSKSISIEKDVEIKILHQNESTLSIVTVAALLFHTGFMGSGLIRIRRNELEIPTRDYNAFDRISMDFSIDLILSQQEGKMKTPISYDGFLDERTSKNLAKLTQFHIVAADPVLVKSLEEQGHKKLLVKLALQRANNEIHDAHEYITNTFTKSLCETIEKELIEQVN